MHAFIFLKSAFLRQCFPYQLKSTFVSMCFFPSGPWVRQRVCTMWGVRGHPHCTIGNWSWRQIACWFSLFRQILLPHKVSVFMDRSMLLAFSGYNLHCVCLKHNQCLPVNKTHCVKASCLSKLINPVGLKVRKPNETHAGLLKFCLWFSLASLESTTHRSISA